MSDRELDNLTTGTVITEEKVQTITGKKFILLGLPLLIYPVVFIVSMMSLAAENSSERLMLLVIVVKLFLWGSLLYPLVYIICLISFYSTKNEIKQRLSIKIAQSYLYACIALFFAWIFLDTIIALLQTI